CRHLQRQPKRGQRARTRRLLCACLSIGCPYSDTDSESHSHAYSDGHAYCYSDSYTYSNSNADCYTYTAANTHAPDCSDAENSSYSATKALSPGVGESTKERKQDCPRITRIDTKMNEKESFALIRVIRGFSSSSAFRRILRQNRNNIVTFPRKTKNAIN